VVGDTLQAIKQSSPDVLGLGKAAKTNNRVWVYAALLSIIA
jgi:hypothetical protein